jgi:hypothetical protein
MAKARCLRPSAAVGARQGVRGGGDVESLGKPVTHGVVQAISHIISSMRCSPDLHGARHLSLARPRHAKRHPEAVPVIDAPPDHGPPASSQFGAHRIH